MREVRCSACKLPMRPAPIRPSFNECAGIAHLLALATNEIPSTLETDASQMLPVPLSARFRAAHTGEDILFYNNPPMITTHAQLLCNLGEGNAAHTQLTKHPMPHRREIVPAFY